jgi:hypothetical protein
MEYGALLELQNAFLGYTHYLCHEPGVENKTQRWFKAFPDRKAYLYFPEHPQKLVEYEP